MKKYTHFIIVALAISLFSGAIIFMKFVEYGGNNCDVVGKACACYCCNSFGLRGYESCGAFGLVAGLSFGALVGITTFYLIKRPRLNRPVKILLVAVAVILSYFILSTVKKDTDQDNAAPLGAINFNRQGVAIKETSEFNGEDLYILFIDTDRAERKHELKFSDKSICGDDQRSIVCMALSISDYGLTTGRPIEVSGELDGDTVLVSRLKVR